MNHQATYVVLQMQIYQYYWIHNLQGEKLLLFFCRFHQTAKVLWNVVFMIDHCSIGWIINFSPTATSNNIFAKTWKFTISKLFVEYPISWCLWYKGSSNHVWIEYFILELGDGGRWQFLHAWIMFIIELTSTYYSLQEHGCHTHLLLLKLSILLIMYNC